MTENSKKKKIIIGSVVGAVLLVSALAIGLSINIKNEKEAQEVARLEQEQKEKEAQELKEKQEKEEKERQEQERLAKYEMEWSLLEDGQQYLTLGTDYLKRVEKHENGLYSYKITEEFVGTLYSIADGFYNGATMEDLSVILNGALVSLPDNATGKEVYDAFVNYADTVDRSEVVSGEGRNPMEVLTPTNNQSSTNNNSSSNGGGTGTSGGGNSSSGGGGSTNTDNGGSSTPPDNSSNNDSESSGGWGSADGWDVSTDAPEGDPEDHKGGVEGSIGTGGN